MTLKKHARAKIARAGLKRTLENWAAYNEAERKARLLSQSNGPETREEGAARIEAWMCAENTANAAFQSILNGYKRQAGLASKPPSATRALCESLEKRFPTAIKRFSAGEMLTDRQLLQMVERVTGKKNIPIKLNTLRQQLKRQFRTGQKGVELRRGMRKAKRPVAKRLDIRHGEIVRPPMPLAPPTSKPFDIHDAIPGLLRINLAR